ncbi:alpha/beta-hydrolase [Daedaleopsis nitida]|nr:alpha/beta-hydrolase [Daedaleopsis nitida]
MSLCKHCISGVRHEGTPEGKLDKLGGVDVYIATPAEVEYPKDKVLLFFPDGFGLQLVNAQLLADDFARNGFKTVILDYFKGDPVPPDAFSSGNFDLMSWLGKHPVEEAMSDIRNVIDALKAEGVTKFGAVGFCYGGARTAFNLAFTGEIHVVAVSHPSLLQVPDDLNKYLAESKAPLLINSCETDSQFPISAQEQADAILGGGKFAPGYERTYWPGVVHGFAIRGDLSDPNVKAGKEGAFKASVEFLIKYL